MTGDINTLLQNSDAVRSLVMEKKISDFLNKNGWISEHSYFYIDKKENKIRETDFVAKRLWYTKRDESIDIITLWLIGECKSAKNYHIVFTDDGSPFGGINKYSHWIGESAHIDYIAEVIGKVCKLHSDSPTEARQRVKSIMRNIINLAFPNEISAMAEANPTPPNTQFFSTAFRETNIGTEKELDNSVLWRAYLSTQSIMKSVFSSLTEGKAGEIIPNPLDIAIHDFSEIENQIISSAKNAFRRIDIFHPMIIIDSCLWIHNKSNINEISNIRLALPGQGGSGNWIDIISSNMWEEYLEKLTTHYDEYFQKEKTFSPMSNFVTIRRTHS